MKNAALSECIMDRFIGELIPYITDYFASKSSGIYHPKVNYTIPNEEYIVDNWEDICEKLRSLIPLYEYRNEIKEVAVQFLSVFLEKYPQYKTAECLQIKK